MARKARIDIAGCLYHVMSRGIEKRKIFLENGDYKEFLFRLKNNLEKTENKCLAWCLMPNHFHLVILRGKRPLAELMQQLLTGYAKNFNAKYERVGHLFQDRYKAILCELERYLQDMVAYIHLNPLKAGIVKSFEELKKYEWSGHGALMGEHPALFLERKYILSHFGNNEQEAVKRYEDYVCDKSTKFKGGEFSNGKLIKSFDDPVGILGKQEGDEELADYRVLGSKEFIESILGQKEGEPKYKTSREEILRKVEEKTGIRPEEIFRKSSKHKVVKARALYCYLCKERMRISGKKLAEELNVSHGTVSFLVHKGGDIWEKRLKD